MGYWCDDFAPDTVVESGAPGLEAVSVDVTEPEVEPALYGAGGEVLLWRTDRRPQPFGFGRG